MNKKLDNITFEELHNYINNDIGLNKLSELDSYKNRLKMAYTSDHRIAFMRSLRDQLPNSSDYDDIRGKPSDLDIFYESMQNLYGDDNQRKVMFEETRKMLLRAIFKDFIGRNFYNNESYDIYFYSKFIAPLYHINNYYSVSNDAEQFNYDISCNQNRESLYMFPIEHYNDYSAHKCFLDYIAIIANNELYFINNKDKSYTSVNDMTTDNLENLVIEYNYYTCNDYHDKDNKMVKMINVNNGNVLFYDEKGELIIDGN